MNDLIAEFEAGSVILASPLILNNTIAHTGQLYQLANEGNWAELSKLVIEINTDDDLDWYYLGLSAEKLGYPEAAEQYYRNSDASNIRLCDPAAGYERNMCYGLRLPADADTRRRNLPNS